MPIIAGKRCSHCGGHLVEDETYPEGDREIKCLACGRLDSASPVPDFVRADVERKRRRGWRKREKR